MAALTDIERQAIAQRHPEVLKSRLLQRFVILIGLAACVLYTVYCWWFFSIGAVLGGANWSIAGSYLADWVSYESRPDIRLYANHLEVKFPRFDPLGDNPKPDWLKLQTARVEVVSSAAKDVSGGGEASSSGSFMASGSQTGPIAGRNISGEPDVGLSVTRLIDAVVKAEIAMGDGFITVTPGTVTVRRGPEILSFEVSEKGGVISRGPLPAWAHQKGRGAIVRLYFGIPGRIEIDNDEVAVRQRFVGWANFVFDTDSPFWSKPVSEVFALVVSGDRIRPERSNLALAWNNFLNNAEWQHADVWLKLLQTIVMAFVGTLLATLIAFPLSFIAARNITPSGILNQSFKRFFDFLRSVDMLIWALFFTRAFGPGPLAGMSAIFFTDTGTLGKLYAEALENVDDKQREGVRSVGADPVLVQRFGVLPQILPVFLSQSLYFWESNTRSATIIGAVGAGGIGLKLWEAMRTNQDWENVFYMVLLILAVVFIFDGISNALRQRLIRPKSAG